MRTLAFAGMAAVLLTAPGCIIAVSDHDWDHHATQNRVERHELDALVASNRQAHLGMDRDEVLALYPADLTTLRTTAADGDAVIEVWQVHAATRNGDHTFSRWIYFRNGRLVELADERVDWENTDRLDRWRSF